MDNKPTPRVNSARLGAYKGQVVRLVGKTIKLQGSTAIVEASDKGQVEITLNRDTVFTDTYVEIIGRVNEDLTLHEFTTVNLGNNIDMSVVDSCVEMMHRDPTIFL